VERRVALAADIEAKMILFMHRTPLFRSPGQHRTPFSFTLTFPAARSTDYTPKVGEDGMEFGMGDTAMSVHPGAWLL
jgi:hypothetical protein